MRSSLYPLVSLALTFASVLFAGSSVSGVVHDPAGAAVSGATVRLESVSGSTALSIVTSTDGKFRFDNVRAASALLVVESPGFERVVKEIAPNTKNAQDLNLMLALRVLSQQVSVTSSGYLEDLDNSARATSVLGRDELDKRFAFSVTEALRQTPGVRITQLGGPLASTNIRIRGLRAQDTAVLIDGMRFRDPAAISGDASSFTQDMLTLNISRLEVLRGCGSSLYGSNAMGGVLNIVSDSGGGRFRGDVLAEGGGLGFVRGQVRLAGGTAQNRLNYSLGLAHVNVMEGVDGDDRARNSSAQGFLQFRPVETLQLSARLSSSNSFIGVNLSPSLTSNAPRTGFVNAIPLPADQTALRAQGLPFTLGDATVFPAANDPDSRRSAWFTSALFAADQQLSPRLSYRAAYQLVDVRRDFPNGPGGVGFQPTVRDLSNFNGHIDTVQGRVNWVGNQHIFSGGAEWERESFDNGGTSFALNPALNSSYRARVSQREIAGFAEDRWRFLNSRLQVTLSGRFQKFDLSLPSVTGSLPAYLTAAVPSPPNSYTGDASAMYRFERTNTKIRAHVGNAFRAPSLYERYGTGFYAGVFTPYGDPRLAPERTMGGDAGIDQYFGNRRVRISATYFYTQLRSVVGFDFSGLINRTTDPFGRTSGYFNTDGGLARGAEVEVQTTLWRGFNLTGSYTHTRTLERRPVAAGTLKTPRIFEHMVTVAATQTYKRLTLTANFLGSPEFIGVISGRAVMWEGPRRLDASASYRLHFGEKIKPELFGRVENLLDQTYYEDGFRTPGRWGVVGLKVSF